MAEAPDRLQVWESKDGWRWRRLDGNNGDHLASSDQGYTDKQHAIDMAVKLNRDPYILEVAL